MKPDNLLYTLLLPNTLKCIVFQKTINNLAIKHNELRKSHHLKKISEKKQRQLEGAQLQKRVKIPLNNVECPQNIDHKKQFEMYTKRMRLDEGVYLKKKSKLTKKVGFSPTFYRRASIVDNDIDKIMTPLKSNVVYGRSLLEDKDQAPTPHFRCTQV